MKHSAIGLAAAFLFISAQANAAEMTSSFASLGGKLWSVDLAVVNDGSPPAVSGFTVYFADTLYADLLLTASPASWDSLVIQPDPGLASEGFLDSFMLDRSQPLTNGQSQGGFSVQFSYAGAGSPTALRFEIVDESYNVLYAGQTVPAGPVPEPTPALMTMVGIGITGLWARRQRRRIANAEPMRVADRVAP